MAARVIDDDPQLAHEHALAASRRAGRVGVVRESVGITAYAVGDFALALRELRTYRRISGRDDQIALMVDSERGVGRPDRALEVARAVDRASLPTAVRVDLAIAMSGAQLDLGRPERALEELDIPELDPNTAHEWSAALFAARAAVLSDLGRDDEAAKWQRRAEVAEEAIHDALADHETVLIEEIIDDAGEHDRVPRGSGRDEISPAADADDADADGDANADDAQDEDDSRSTTGTDDVSDADNSEADEDPYATPVSAGDPALDPEVDAASTREDRPEADA